MKACLNSGKANLALEVRNPVPGSFGCTVFLDLTILDQLTIPISSSLSPPTPALIVLPSSVDPNLLAEEPFIMVFSMEISEAAILLKS